MGGGAVSARATIWCTPIDSPDHGDAFFDYLIAILAQKLIKIDRIDLRPFLGEKRVFYPNLTKISYMYILYNNPPPTLGHESKYIRNP